MVRVIATGLALLFTGAALADDWKGYENWNYFAAIGIAQLGRLDIRRVQVRFLDPKLPYPPSHS